MIFNILNIIHTKIFYLHDIVFNTFFKENKSIENNEYVCPDYIADETTITQNLYCVYDNKIDDSYDEFNCINFIIFFIIMNIFYVSLFVFIEKMCYILNNIIKGIFLKNVISNNQDNNNSNVKYGNKYRINNEEDTEEILEEDTKEILEEDTEEILEENNNNNSNLFNKNKDDIEEFFYNYSEIIKIQQFLNKDNNLDKVLNFYKESTNYLQQTKEILNDKYRNIFLNKDTFLNYYKIESDNVSVSNTMYLKFMDIDSSQNLYTSCKDKVSINLSKLYDTEQMMVDYSLFNINNDKKYFPLKKENLCYLTNLSKLNVIIWLIEIGFYDYLEKHV